MQLRPFQSEALARLQRPGHLLCIAPTGSGKSLIYEKLAGEPGRRTLLITPLVALARQQGERLRDLGIQAVIYPGSDPKPSSPVRRRMKTGVWILSPESLLSRSVVSELPLWNPDFLVVDECHCLFDWGEHFRTAFAEIPPLVRSLQIPRSLWLTATLPKDADVELERLIGEPLARVGSFSLPPNLHLDVIRSPWVHRAEHLFETISRENEPGIVFVTTRDATQRVSRLLAGFGRKAISYHAGMSQEERRLIEHELRRHSDAVLVATSAFGMGMDYPHLRWAVLWQPAPSLLALAQAIGRIARRHELTARATLLWDDEDFRTLEWMTRGSERRVQALREVRSYLMTSSCRIRALETHFNPGSPSIKVLFCTHCDFCKSSAGA